MKFRKLIPLFLLSYASTASAYFSEPRAVPAEPVAGQPFLVKIDTGEAHGFIVPPFGIPQPRVEIDRNIIRFFQPGSIDLLNNFPPNTASFESPSLLAGEYTIEVHMIRFPQMTEIFLASSSITVRGAASRPTVVPTTSVAALALLAAIIFLIAIRAGARGR